MSTTAPSTTKNLEKENSSQGSSSSNNPLLLQNIPTCAGTPWAGAGSMLGNLYELRKGLANLSHIYFQHPIKIEATIPWSGNPHAIITLKVEKYGWGPNYPICQNIENEEEGWNSDRNIQDIPCTQGTQYPQNNPKSIWCTRQVFRTDKAPQKMGGENGKT